MNSDLPPGKFAVRMRLPIGLVIAFVALYLLAVCTPFGQTFEDSLLRGYSSDTWLGEIQYSIGPPPIRGEELTFFIGVALIALAALVRRRWWLAAASVFVPVATAATTFALNRFILPRPNFADPSQGLIETSFPSGHVAITELTSNSYDGWLDSVTDASYQFPLENSPAVFVNGKQLLTDAVTPTSLRDAIG